MGYATLMEFDVDLDTHRKIVDAVGDEPGKGLIVHAAGPSANGVYSLDVWDSKEDADRYFVERIIPAMEKAGIAGGPPLSVQEFDLPVIVR